MIDICHNIDGPSGTEKGKYCMVSYVKSKKRKEKKAKVIETGSIKLVSKG